MDESTFDTVLPEKATKDSSKPPVPMSNVEQTVIAVAIALVIVFASSAATIMKK
jgi:hypothetical protein